MARREVIYAVPVFEDSDFVVIKVVVTPRIIFAITTYLVQPEIHMAPLLMNKNINSIM
jgi:hypothetical protein